MSALVNNTNLTTNHSNSETRMEYFREPGAVKVVKLGLEALMALFGIFGNLCVCIVVSRRMHMKTVINLYIRNLAIADLGVLIVSFPLAIVRQELDSWPLGEFFCKYIYPGSDIFYGASIWSITVIAIERYRNIVARERIRHESSKKAVYWWIGLIWIASFVTQCVPVYIYMEYDRSLKLCVARFPAGNGAKISAETQVYTLSFLAFLYIIPMVIICWTYIQISRRIRQSSAFNKHMHDDGTKETEKLGENKTERRGGYQKYLWIRGKSRKDANKRAGKLKDSIRLEEKKRLKQNNKAKRILTPLVVIFALTMFPYHAVKVLVMYWLDLARVKYFWVLFTICSFLLVVNSCLNPLIYAMVSQDFRNAFKRLLPVWNGWKCAHETQRESGATSKRSASHLVGAAETPEYKRGFFKLHNSPRNSTHLTIL